MSRLRTRRADEVPHVGFFGLLGAGNLGNDGSFEVILDYIRGSYPDAVVTVRCSGPAHVTQRYGVSATRLHWFDFEHRPALGFRSAVLKAIGKVVDAFRTLSWVRRQDVVFVSGMGVLESTLPLRPWGFPYSLLCLCVSGRIVGTKVMLVSVGADVVSQRVTRWVITQSAKLAHYRSYRDNHSRAAMSEMGLDTTTDEVYTDIAFALPAPITPVGEAGVVGVGVMAYYGGNGDRRMSNVIHRTYVETMTHLVRWFVEHGREVRLLVGDSADAEVSEEILADLREQRPGAVGTQVFARPVADLPDLLKQLAAVDTVVATRYHNVVCALKLSKPTLSIGYAAKSDALMASMGLAEFCQRASSIDFERLVEQFEELESRREQLVATMRAGNRRNTARLAEQFAVLSEALAAATETVTPELNGGEQA